MDCNPPAPLSMGFSRQEYWSGSPCLPERDLPDPGMEPAPPASPASSGGFFTAEPSGMPILASIYPYLKERPLPTPDFLSLPPGSSDAFCLVYGGCTEIWQFWRFSWKNSLDQIRVSSVCAVLSQFRVPLEGFPGLLSGSDGKEICEQCRTLGFSPWSVKIPHAREQLSPYAIATEPEL